MEKNVRLIAILLTIVLAVSGCQMAELFKRGEAVQARTYYEALSLGSPEDAVHAFMQAFQEGDFMTVYLILDGATQKALRLEFAKNFSWEHMIGQRVAEDILDQVYTIELHETHSDFWYTFDQIMLSTAEQDDLLIDLRGNLEILRTEESRSNDGRHSVDIIASVESVQGEVLFRTVQGPDDRWRIYLVSAPGEGVDSWPASTLLDAAE